MKTLVGWNTVELFTIIDILTTYVLVPGGGMAVNQVDCCWSGR